jgi:hypothetical protein
MPKLITLLHFSCLLLLGFWSRIGQAAPPDAVVRGLPGTDGSHIDYSNIYFAGKGGYLRSGSFVPVHFNENSYSPTLVYFPAFKPGRMRGQRQPPPGMLCFKPPTLVVMPGDTVDMSFNSLLYTFEFRGRHQAELDFCRKVWQSTVSLDG